MAYFMDKYSSWTKIWIKEKKKALTLLIIQMDMNSTSICHKITAWSAFIQCSPWVKQHCSKGSLYISLCVCIHLCIVTHLSRLIHSLSQCHFTDEATKVQRWYRQPGRCRIYNRKYISRAQVFNTTPYCFSSRAIYGALTLYHSYTIAVHQCGHLYYWFSSLPPIRLT